MDPIFQVKKAFFDRTKIVRLMDAKTREAFNRYGGFVRKVAQRSQRPRKGSSIAPNPPYAHGQKELRKHNYYSYDEATQTLVCGPIRFKSGSVNIPKLHEHGGETVTVKKSGGTKTRHYPARPTMKPAMETTIEKLKHYYAQ